MLAELDTGERNRLTKRAARLRKAALRSAEARTARGSSSRTSCSSWSAPDSIRWDQTGGDGRTPAQPDAGRTATASDRRARHRHRHRRRRLHGAARDGRSRSSRRPCRATSPAGSRATSPSATTCSSSGRASDHRVTAVLAAPQPARARRPARGAAAARDRRQRRPRRRGRRRRGAAAASAAHRPLPGGRRAVGRAAGARGQQDRPARRGAASRAPRRACSRTGPSASRSCRAAQSEARASKTCVQALAGHTCVFVGQSGVGKSSLLTSRGYLAGVTWPSPGSR